MIIEMPPPYKSDYLSFGFAREPWQLRQYRDLRKAIFCDEQGIFSGSDQDKIDKHALPIVAIATCGGMLDRIVGVVRIDERKPGIWYGSRLGVAADYRKLTRFGVDGLFDDRRPVSPFDQSVGAGLIYKAVSTAKALGAKQFYATVQEQNVRFFEKMYWKSLYTLDLHGRPHALMAVDLGRYPANRRSMGQLRLAA